MEDVLCRSCFVLIEREREKIEDFRRWFHIFIIVSFRGKYNLQLQSAITKCIFRIFILIL